MKILFRKRSILITRSIAIILLISPVLSFAQVKTIDVVQGLIKDLSNPNPEIRLDAAVKLKDCEPPAKEALPYLELALDDVAPKVKLAAAHAFFEIGYKTRASMKLSMRLAQKVFSMGPEAIKEFPFLKQMGYNPISHVEAEKAFHLFWNTIDREYAMFIIKPELDWNKLKTDFENEAVKANSLQELYAIFSQMLYPFNDEHISISLKGRSQKLVSRRLVPNYNKDNSIYSDIIGTIHQANKNVVWAKTDENIGYLAIIGWNEVDIPEQVDNLLEEMRGTRGLIIDVRMNRGGNEELARLVAGRFIEKPYIYAYHQYRNGPEHADLTEKIPRIVKPREPWRYDRPVILLMGNLSMSSNESFIAMMDACPQMTTMGNSTRGASGNPREFEVLPDLKINLPRWIAYMKNGEILEGNGIQPDVNFEFSSQSFSDRNDELLSLAINTLKKEEVPSLAIVGPSIYDVRQKEALEKERIPKVIHIEPKPNAKNISPEFDMKIQFDMPMNPSTISLSWLEGGFHDCGKIKYDESTNTFHIKMELEPKCRHKISLNTGNGLYFRSTHGKIAEEYEWTFTTKKGKRFLPKDIKEDKPEDIENVLTKVVSSRNNIKNIAETVTSMEFLDKNKKGFKRLISYSSRFKYQEDNYFYADISDKQGHPFYIVGTGLDCGYLTYQDSMLQFVVCPLSEITGIDVNIAKIFSFEPGNIRSFIQEQHIEHNGLDRRNNKTYYNISASADKTIEKVNWWLDTETNLLERKIQVDELGNKKIHSFDYLSINQIMPESDFFPPMHHKYFLKPNVLEVLPKGSMQIIEINDGSNGSIVAKWRR